MKQTQILTHWNGSERSEEEVIQELKAVSGLYGRYSQMDQEWKRRFMDFCCGKKTLPLTYDPFFKKIFHPDIHPERLSRLISSLLGVVVKVKGILPTEDSMLDGESLLILDVLVELEDGTLTNIEVQKCPYAFPAERMSCYSSDLIMRQYTRTKGEKGKYFTYHDMKKVYTIILFEKSTDAFHLDPPCYIHYGKTVFNTGLELGLLQEYCLIALDEFRKYPYPKDRNEQTAWLSLLATEDIKEADKLIEEYPWLEEIYQETADLRKRPEEVLGMYSEALRILDRNTVRYMIEEQKKEIEQNKKELEQQNNVIKEQERKIQENNAVIEERNAVIEERNAVIEEKGAMIEEKNAVIKEKDAVIEEKDIVIEEKNAILERQQREIEELKQKLEQLQ